MLALRDCKNDGCFVGACHRIVLEKRHKKRTPSVDAASGESRFERSLFSKNDRAKLSRLTDEDDNGNDAAIKLRSRHFAIPHPPRFSFFASASKASSSATNCFEVLPS